MILPDLTVEASRVEIYPSGAQSSVEAHCTCDLTSEMS